jgi:phosphoglycolate phosphatase
VRTFVGSGARMLVQRAVTAHGRAELTDDVLVRFRAAYERSLLGETVVYDGVVAMLAEVRAHADMHCVVCTNKPGVYARPLVNALLPGHIALTVGPDDVGALKPDPAMLAHAARTVGGVVVAHVGDSRIDVDTARAHGARAIAVAWGLGPRDELAGADDLVATPADLGRVLAAVLRS